jgi:hypothetical protein
MANSNGLSVNELRSKRDLRLLDTIDKLRSQGISQYVSLPQIIVCGDQSSGKSSVLETISGVPFPSKSNLCTRFPTELILRKHDVENIDVSIVAHPDSKAHDKARLAGFAATLKDVNQLPALIERAKTTMGLDENSSAFSKHTLRVETSGPTLPHLTIVDLPGLIHSANKRQTGSDVAVIKSVVERYMLEPRSIILAVISAKNDYANQIVLNMAREVDKDGTRTLGVITKPDTLHPKSESERTYINLARNKKVQFCHGWHVVKNLDSDKGVATRAERDAKEKEFFATGSWASLHSSIKGIETLRKRLSSVLYHQVSAELPKLLEEISNNKKTNEKKLAKLGEPRDTESKQRRYLTQCAAEFQSLITAALNGNYHDPFFEDRDGVKGYDKRIRAVVAGNLTEYSEFMAKYGRLHRVVSRPDRLKAVGSEILITEDDLLRNISQRMIESRGRELPGMVNTSVVSDLFRQESRLWENLTLIHIKALWAAVVEAIRHLAWHCADASTARSVFEIAIKPKLTKYRDNMEAEILESLISHRDIHATTFNRYYTESLQNIRLERYTSAIYNRHHSAVSGV